MLHRLSYVSRAAIDRCSADFMDIARVSLQRNKAEGLTGALYYDDEQFFQVLEGDAAAVRATFARIRRDPRHHSIAVVSEGPADARLFEGWAMKFLDGAWVRDGRRLFAPEALSSVPPGELSRRIATLAAP